MSSWPIIGDHIQSIWSLASSNLGDAIKKYSGYFVQVGGFAIGLLATKGIDLILFILAVIFSGYVLAHAANMMDGVRKMAKRIYPQRGSTFVEIMAETIQNVSRGVIGVSLLELYFWITALARWHSGSWFASAQLFPLFIFEKPQQITPESN